MSASPEPGEDDETKEVPKVQAFGGRVEAAVDPKGADARIGACRPDTLAGDGIDEPPLLQDIHHVRDPSSRI